MIAAFLYNQLLKNWPTLWSLSGDMFNKWCKMFDDKWPKAGTAGHNGAEFSQIHEI